MKRTDIKDVEEKLIEEFGGMVEKIETGMMIHPHSFDQMIELLQLQNKKVLELESMISAQQNLLPVDSSEDIEKIKKELEESRKREEENRETVIGMNEKLQTAVNFIQKMEAKRIEKKLFWKRLLDNFSNGNKNGL